ncbi:SCO6745 family protein [Streptomyces sp. NPDC001070]
MTATVPAPALEPRAGRRCHNALNPLHSVVYFSPEYDDGLAALGLERGAMAYFAGRAAPLGAVSAGTVTATFYNFNHAIITPVIPRAWELAAPGAVVEARLRVADTVLNRLLGPEVLASADLADAARLAVRAAEACTREARPLYAANAELPTPERPHLALWHAATLLREHRGDGHLAALAAAGLDGLEALVTHTATGKGFTPRFVRRSRGWSAEQWDAAQDRLRERGLLDTAGDLTDRGVELRREIEGVTDRLDRAPYEHLGAAGVDRLTSLAGALAHRLLSNGGFPLEHFGKG